MIIYALKRGLAYDIGHGKAALRRVLIAHENEEDYTMIYEDGDQEVEPHENTLSVKITFATLSVLHGVVKHAIFAGVYR